MSAPRDPLSRVLLLFSIAATSLALLIGAAALLVRAIKSPAQALGVVVAGPDAPATSPARAATSRFTLRLGQGFRFKDAAVVTSDDQPDLLFKYLPPQVGGLALRYNPISQNVEQGLEPTLTSPVPLLVSKRIQAFDGRPNLGRIATGDAAAFYEHANITAKTRHVLLQTHSGEAYLLTLDELHAVPGKYDDWRIGFSYERVTLPLGLAGGRITKPLPGKLIFRDWCRSQMIVRVDLATGREESIADGTLPSAAAGRLGYGDPSQAYVIRDASGKTLHTIRFNEVVMGPQLSPDGKRLLGWVYRPAPDTIIGGVAVPSAPTQAVAIFDLAGRETFCLLGYDDAAWAPDGKLIATGKLYDAGLFEIDPATKKVTAIDAAIGNPGQVAVSPDGGTIAFVSGGRVWLIDRDGRNLRQLLKAGRVQQRPAFSPDGSKLAAVICTTVANDLTGEVFVIDLKTSELTALRTSAGLSLLPDTTTRLNWVP